MAHAQGSTEFGQRHRSARDETSHHGDLRTREAGLFRLLERVAEQIPPERPDVGQHFFRLMHQGWVSVTRPRGPFPEFSLFRVSHLTSSPPTPIIRRIRRVAYDTSYTTCRTGHY